MLAHAIPLALAIMRGVRSQPTARISRPWILSAGANAFGRPLFHFTFDPRGRPTAELHRFWEVTFLYRVV